MLLRKFLGGTAKKPARCADCVHWDHAEGQAIIQRNPLFATRVAPFISPNDMMRKVVVTKNAAGEEVSDVLPPENPLRQVENGWEHFGACMLKEHARHRSDVCPSFRPRGKK